MFWTILIISKTQAFFPGLTEKTYKKHQEIRVSAGTLSSTRTQFPLSHYYLDFCESQEDSQEFSNIGQALTADVTQQTPYNITMRSNQICSKLCNKELGKEKIESFKWAIQHEYKVQWYLDSLPSGRRISDIKQEVNFAAYQDGFPVGYYEKSKFFIYNHHHFIIKISKNKQKIVGFLVHPFSLSNQNGFGCEIPDFFDFIDFSKKFKEIHLRTSHKNESERLDLDFLPQELTQNISFSYSVSFEKSEVSWESRWEVYLYSVGSKVHWISVSNFCVVVLVLGIVVRNILKKAVSRDFNIFNESSELEFESEFKSDSSWKQLEEEVFLSPAYPNFFSILVGSGVQIIIVTFFVLIFACLSFFPPDKRGYFITGVLFIYSLTGFASGIVSGWLYRIFNGLYWKKNALGTSVMIPGIFFTTFVILNTIKTQEDPTLSISFNSFFEIILIWIGIFLPVSFLGSAFGYQNQTIVSPSVLKVSKPLPLSFSFQFYLTLFFCSLVPFGSAFTELSYIMSSVWEHLTFYYLSGFLLLCFVMLLVISGEISVLAVYSALCQGEYRWWWLSFVVAGCSGVYLYLYTIYYFFLMRLTVKGTVLYFGYMTIGCLVLSLITGSAGFISSFFFVRKVFSVIKQD